MSYREKSAWIMAALMAISGCYYLYLAVNVPEATAWGAFPFAIMVPFTLLVVSLSITGQTIIAVLSPTEANAAADERERPLLDRAGHWAGIVLGAGVVGSLLHFLYRQDGPALFHMIVSSLILSQLVEYAFQITLLRRSC